MSDPICPRTDDFLTASCGTHKEISPGVLLNPPERATNEASADAGVWECNQPVVAPEYAEHAVRVAGSTGDTRSGVVPLRARAEKVGTLRTQPDMEGKAVLASLRGAPDGDYDAIKIKNYTTPDGTTPVTMFRLPTGGVVDEAIVPNHLRPRDRRVY